MKSHMPVGRQGVGGGLEGNEICLGNQSDGGEIGMGTLIIWLDCRCCCFCSAAPGDEHVTSQNFSY